MVGGPGFEPGASRSRTLRHIVQKPLKRSISVRIVSQADRAHGYSGLLFRRIATPSATQQNIGCRFDRLSPDFIGWVGVCLLPITVPMWPKQSQITDAYASAGGVTWTLR
jgi:hypothetical protein